MTGRRDLSDRSALRGEEILSEKTGGGEGDKDASNERKRSREFEGGSIGRRDGVRRGNEE